jgi:hypothetical protein
MSVGRGTADALLPGMNDTNDDEIVKLARKRVEERLGLLTHVTMYALVNTGIVITWRLTGSSYPWFIWPMVGWGAGVAAHALAYWFGPSSLHGRKAVDREVRRLRGMQREGEGAASGSRG